MNELSLAKAKTIIQGAFEEGEKLKLQPLSVIVLDPGGHMIAFERQDGAAPGRYQIADGKANAALMLGMPSSKLMARAEQQAYFVDALNGAYGGRIIPVPGGVLIKNAAGETLGAVGVTGDTSDNDAAAASAGIASAGFEFEA